MYFYRPLRYAFFSLVVLQVSGSWVDPDTPEGSLITEPLSAGDERSFKLVSSTELVTMPYNWMRKVANSMC